MKIRVSPSGPFIENSSNAPLEFGPGAMLRLVEAQGIVAGTIAVSSVPLEIASSLGGTDFRLALTAPNPGKAYRATIACDVRNTTTSTAATVELYLQSSVDNGATWTTQASNEHTINAVGIAASSVQARHIRLDLTLTDGGNISVTSSPQTAGIIFRALIGTASGGPADTVRVDSNTTPAPGVPGTSVGTVYFGLSEHF